MTQIRFLGHRFMRGVRGVVFGIGPFRRYPSTASGCDPSGCSPLGSVLQCYSHVVYGSTLFAGSPSEVCPAAANEALAVSRRDPGRSSVGPIRDAFSQSETFRVLYVQVVGHLSRHAHCPASYLLPEKAAVSERQTFSSVFLFQVCQRVHIVDQENRRGRAGKNHFYSPTRKVGSGTRVAQVAHILRRIAFLPVHHRPRRIVFEAVAARAATEGGAAAQTG